MIEDCGWFRTRGTRDTGRGAEDENAMMIHDDVMISPGGKASNGNQTTDNSIKYCKSRMGFSLKKEGNLLEAHVSDLACLHEARLEHPLVLVKRHAD